MGASRIFKIDTPWTEDQLTDLGYEQTADVVYLTHPAEPVHRLLRYGHSRWVLEEADFGTKTVTPTGVAVSPTGGGGGTPVTHRYVVTAIDTLSGQESLASSIVSTSNDLDIAGHWNTVSWSAVTGADRYVVYKEVNGIYGFIGGSAGLTFRDDNIIADLGTTPPGNRDPFNAANNYPARVTFYDQRSIFGRSYAKASGIWTSQAADFQNMNASRPARAADAITLSLVGRQVNAIQHLVPLKVLLIFTTDAVFSVKGADGFLSGSDIPIIAPESYRGSSNVRPVTVDDIVFFNTAKGNAIRTVGYEFERDGYRGNDLSVYVPHFFKDHTLRSMAWTDEPMSVLWAVRSDGKLLSLTWQEEQDVWGWTLCQTDGFVEDCCSITENGEDVLYVIVKRTLGEGEDAVEHRYVERMASLNWAVLEDAIYLDSARTYEGDPVDTLSGLSHLEGRTVSALADGKVVEELVVTDGEVTLRDPASKVHVGLPFTAWIQTLPPGGATRDGGSTKGSPQGFSTVAATVVRTRGIEIAPGRRVDPFEAETPEDAALPVVADEQQFYDMRKQGGARVQGDPFTGELHADIPPGDWTEATLVIRQRYPLPMTITGVFPKVEAVQ